MSLKTQKRHYSQAFISMGSTSDCTMPFYIRDLSILGFWYPPGSWNQFPEDTEYKFAYCFLIFYQGQSFDFGRIRENAFYDFNLFLDIARFRTIFMDIHLEQEKISSDCLPKHPEMGEIENVPFYSHSEYIYKCVCVCVCVCVCARACVCIHIYVYTHLSSVCQCLF